MAGRQNTARRALPLGKERENKEREKRPLQKLQSPEAVNDAHKLDRLVHERLRLGMLSALAVNESLTFNDLKKLLNTTDGNMSVHARKLEEAGYVSCTKSFAGRLPRTDYKLTPAGRRALDRYLDHMEALIQATREK
jgi:DNA-binding MarR family transcriptional regulator